MPPPHPAALDSLPARVKATEIRIGTKGTISTARGQRFSGMSRAAGLHNGGKTTTTLANVINVAMGVFAMRQMKRHCELVFKSKLDPRCCGQFWDSQLHLLKSYAFKARNPLVRLAESQQKFSATLVALRLAREAEYFAGILSAFHGREHIALTAAFLKGDESVVNCRFVGNCRLRQRTQGIHHRGRGPHSLRSFRFHAF
jgi:hypothetical protein